MPNWTAADLARTKAGARHVEASRNGRTAPKTSSTPHKTAVAIAQTTDEEKLNKTERGWLGVLRTRPEIVHIGIQDHTLKLADNCRYTPDFMSLDADGQVTFWEVKGFFRDDAKVKVKVAARKFPFYRFVVVFKRDGKFTEEKVKI